MSELDLPIITTSERSTFRKCPQKWWWKYRMGLTSTEETADALWFGTGVHIALAKWYLKGRRRGPHPADTFEDWVGAEMREIRANYASHDREWFDEPKFEDALDLGTNMLTHYVEHYGRDPQWQIIAIETPFKVQVTRHGDPIALFMSAWDGVLRDLTDGRIYLLENKTASQIMLAYLELDDQAGSYFAVASAVLRARGILKPNEEIAGIVYNFLRKSKKDERPRNEGGAYLNANGTVSKRQPPERFVRHKVERLASEQRTQMERLADEVAVMNAMRAGTIPVYKNTTRDCTFCEFFIMCQLHEQGNDNWREVAAASYRQRNPYDRYVKSAGNGA
jgi:PD-(D/E)XK nuclease superfamily